MKYCYNCGAKLEDEDKFCINCGAKCNPLETDSDGKNNKSNNLNPGIDISIIERSLINIRNIFLGIIIKPFTTIKYCITNLQVSDSIILLFLLAIINGLFTIWSSSQFLSTTKSAILGIAGTFYNTYDMQNAFQSIKIPYGSVFGYSALFFIIIAIIISILIFVIYRIFNKSNQKYTCFFNIVLCAFVMYTYFIFISIIFEYISLILGQALFITGVISAIICTFYGFNELCEDKEKGLYIFLLSNLIICVTILLTGKWYITSILKKFIY